MTKEELERYVAAHPEQKDALQGLLHRSCAAAAATSSHPLLEVLRRAPHESRRRTARSGALTQNASDA